MAEKDFPVSGSFPKWLQYQELGTPSSSPMWVTGGQATEPFLCSFRRHIAGSWK